MKIPKKYIQQRKPLSLPYAVLCTDYLLRIVFSYWFPIFLEFSILFSSHTALLSSFTAVTFRDELLHT